MPRAIASSCFCILLLAASLSSAQQAPTIASPPPLYLQTGQSRDVTLKGQALTAVSSVLVAGPPGLEATLVNAETVSDNEARVHLSAAAGIEPGDREVRLSGPHGVSAPVIVAIGPYRAVEEQDTNDHHDQPRNIELPAEITGRISRAGDVNQFRFAAHKDQHLIFDVHVTRLGSPLEPVIVIHNADTGRELPATVEFHGGDPLLLFVVPADGQYIVELRDLRYRGGDNFVYRVATGALPYLEAVMPMSGQRGGSVTIHPIGHNLQGALPIPLDLTQAALGTMFVRATTSAGFSNSAPFEVISGMPSLAPAAGGSPESAAVVPIPCEVSGQIGEAGSEHFYRFHLSKKQVVQLTALSRSIGSPLDGLLALRTANGDVLELNNGSAGVDPSIRRELEPGDFVMSLRDLGYAGGSNFLYRIQLRDAQAPEADAEFAVHFLPDTPRLHRGGYGPLWCEVIRPPGFRQDVNVELEGLPAGVTCAPVAISESTSGFFTLSAKPDAALGTFPIWLKATVASGKHASLRYGVPESAGRSSMQAYLTVLDHAPFEIAPFAYNPRSIEPFVSEIAAIKVRLNAPDDKLDAEEAAWEKQVLSEPTWTVIVGETVSANAGTKLTRQPDGSYLASGAIPAKDTYTLTAATSLKGITAFRLEALTDPSLPAHGPGAAPNGNFVLDEFKVTQELPGKSSLPIALKLATADFSQDGFPVQNAIDNNPGTGWAISPQFGVDHTAIFTVASPASDQAPSTLKFVLEQQSQFAQHLIGRFRLSATTADSSALPKQSVPEAIMAILRAAPGQRTAEQKGQVKAFYRQNNPQLAALRTRLHSLEALLAPWNELLKAESALDTPTPKLADEQAKWEQTPAAQAAPVPLNIIALVKTPPEMRTESEKSALAAYYRLIAPSLQPAREEAAELRARFNLGPAIGVRGKQAEIPVVLSRAPDFNGDVQVTLEGFSAGRDSATRLPTAISKNLKLAPLTLGNGVIFGLLSFTPEAGCELGSREVVLHGASQVGGQPIEQFSSAFPLTVNEK